MRILVVGSGGREHALVWKLSQEAEVIAAPGNPGMDCECFDVSATDLVGMESLCQRLAPDLVVVGPEDPLVAGLGDRLRTAGFNVFGPNADGAQLEASKAFSKEMMLRAGVPTASSGTFTDPEEALAYSSERFEAGFQVVVKASGNALGKGVVICLTLDEAEDAIAEMMIEGAFGEAGRTVVIEDRLIGREFSLLTIVSDGQFASLPVARDYKRALDGDRGPNTGGMGTYSPCDWISPRLLAETEARIVQPMVNQMVSDGISYRGVLFSGIMVVNGSPMCLEYNVRFGDPETQSVVRRLGFGFGEVLMAAAKGEPLPAVEASSDAAVTVVVASAGYPGSIKKGLPIQLEEMPEGVVVYHAGTKLSESQLVTNGGRVLAVSAIGKDLDEARELAYRGVAQVRFDGAFFRKDIASIG
ncbi:MAG: phosphoribosylamine--glycine ligase [Chthonomonas sp.]|nr:phosphoribosylamine--glycine ligase [Chthonomonas sp.]